MRVAVGSQNPVKIEAARLAFAALWPNERWEVSGAEVDSGVSSQPMSDEESIRGARNRAIAARDSLGADYGVGLEGGLQKIGEHYFDCGWAVIVNRAGAEGIGSTVKIMTPPKITTLIHSGLELGHANDQIFGAVNSKQAEGHFGLMTNNIITRTQGYRDGLIAALARFVHERLF